MKGVLIICLLGYSLNSFSQQGDLPRVIVSVADSFRLKYPYHGFYADTDASVKYSVNNERRYQSFSFPKIEDIQTARTVFAVLDSLARTRVYTNRLFAHEMYGTIIESLNHDGKTLSKNFFELLTDIINSDIANCLRVTDGAILLNLRKDQFTKGVIGRIEKLYRDPFLSVDEATILVQKEQVVYNIKDTAGFAQGDKHFHDLSAERKHDIRKIRTDVYRAKQAQMTLSQYYDSLNNKRRSDWINAWSQAPFPGLQALTKVISDKSIYELAQPIESVCFSGVATDWNKEECQLMLGRLRYKQYPEKMIARYSYKLDSCISLLKSQSMDNMQKDNIFDALRDLSNKLIYINTQDSYFKMAPLLLIEAEVINEFDDSYRLGSVFFLELDQYVKNFPWDRAEHSRVKPGEPAHVVNEWYIENRLPKDFLKKMYQWMIDNKNKYELVAE